MKRRDFLKIAFATVVAPFAVLKVLSESAEALPAFFNSNAMPTSGYHQGGYIVPPEFERYIRVSIDIEKDAIGNQFGKALTLLELQEADRVFYFRDRQIIRRVK